MCSMLSTLNSRPISNLNAVCKFCVFAYYYKFSLSFPIYDSFANSVVGSQQYNSEIGKLLTEIINKTTSTSIFILHRSVFSFFSFFLHLRCLLLPLTSTIAAPSSSDSPSNGRRRFNVSSEKFSTASHCHFGAISVCVCVCALAFGIWCTVSCTGRHRETVFASECNGDNCDEREQFT